MNNKTSTAYKGMVYVEDPGGSGVVGSQVVSKIKRSGKIQVN